MVWYGGRRMGADWGWLAGGALAAAGLFLAVWGWLRLRGRFFSRRDTAAFLDEQLGLHAALSAGEEWGNAVEAGESSVRGIPCCGYVPPGAWPGWWEARFLWLAGLFAVARAASRRAASGFAARSGPGGEVLDRLAEMESVDNKSLEPFREQLEDLKRMHRNEMYSHAGLEAADALKGKTAAAVAGLSNQMYRTDSALSLLDSLNGASSPEAMQSLQEALTGMESLALQPGGIMSRQLQELKASLPSRQIDPETALRLREQLERAAQQLRSMCGQCGISLMASPDERTVMEAGQGRGK